MSLIPLTYSSIYFVTGHPVRCLSPDADQRPDIVAVSSRISDLMMKLMDSLYTSQNALERRAERERKRAQKYFLERHKSRMNCCFSNLSQVKYILKMERMSLGSMQITFIVVQGY